MIYFNGYGNLVSIDGFRLLNSEIGNDHTETGELKHELQRVFVSLTRR